MGASSMVMPENDFRKNRSNRTSVGLYLIRQIWEASSMHRLDQTWEYKLGGRMEAGAYKRIRSTYRRLMLHTIRSPQSLLAGKHSHKGL